MSSTVTSGNELVAQLRQIYQDLAGRDKKPSKEDHTNLDQIISEVFSKLDKSNSCLRDEFENTIKLISNIRLSCCSTDNIELADKANRLFLKQIEKIQTVLEIRGSFSSSNDSKQDSKAAPPLPLRALDQEASHLKEASVRSPPPPRSTSRFSFAQEPFPKEEETSEAARPSTPFPQRKECNSELRGFESAGDDELIEAAQILGEMGVDHQLFVTRGVAQSDGIRSSSTLSNCESLEYNEAANAIKQQLREHISNKKSSLDMFEAEGSNFQMLSDSFFTTQSGQPTSFFELNPKVQAALKGKEVQKKELSFESEKGRRLITASEIEDVEALESLKPFMNRISSEDYKEAINSIPKESTVDLALMFLGAGACFLKTTHAAVLGEAAQAGRLDAMERLIKERAISGRDTASVCKYGTPDAIHWLAAEIGRRKASQSNIGQIPAGLKTVEFSDTALEVAVEAIKKDDWVRVKAILENADRITDHCLNEIIERCPDEKFINWVLQRVSGSFELNPKVQTPSSEVREDESETAFNEKNLERDQGIRATRRTMSEQVGRAVSQNSDLDVIESRKFQGLKEAIKNAKLDQIQAILGGTEPIAESYVRFVVHNCLNNEIVFWVLDQASKRGTC